MTAVKNNRTEYVVPLNTGTAVWFSVLTICVACLIGFLTYSTLLHYRYYELMQEVKKGCANPDNKYATVIVHLPDGMSFTCTPYDTPDFISRQHKRANKKGRKR